MGAGEIISIILGIVTVVLTYFECNTHIKNIITSVANEAINFAEDRNLVSYEKMDKAIEFVQGKLPAIFRPFVTKESIKKIIQAAFDKIEKFVETQQYKK